HIRFRDELQACRKTDSTEELRDRFLFKERGFENISILAYLLNLSAQAAEKSVYHSFSVQLRKGRFRGDFESGGFVLESGNDYRVRVSNLTNRVNRELRKSLTFFIEN
ncbi:MAG: hypothetical protein KAH44_02495, partial [Oricola sp.]|nr:hypothetical protein [Oricola sp.]